MENGAWPDQTWPDMDKPEHNRTPMKYDDNGYEHEHDDDKTQETFFFLDFRCVS